jgi:hypothetical protein
MRQRQTRKRRDIVELKKFFVAAPRSESPLAFYSKLLPVAQLNFRIAFHLGVVQPVVKMHCGKDSFSSSLCSPYDYPDYKSREASTSGDRENIN